MERVKFVPDVGIEDWIREFRDEVGSEPGAVACIDETHVVTWSGSALYLARKRAGIGRAALRDALRARGFDDASVVRIARQERCEAEPTATEARALGAVLGVSVGRLFACGACDLAAYLARNPGTTLPASTDDEHDAADRADVDGALRRISAARRARGLSVLRFATLAGISRRCAVAIERTAAHGVGVNEFGAAVEALGLDLDGRPEHATADAVAVCS